MNHLVIIGNVTKDPESRTVNTSRGASSVCSFTVAVNGRKGNDNAQFFRATAWNGLADNCAKYLSKGKKVMVAGPVGVRTYEGSDGKTRASLEITANDVEFLSPKESGATDQAPSMDVPTTPPPSAFTPVDAGEDLPF